jgi:hypothetical protein
MSDLDPISDEDLAALFHLPYTGEVQLLDNQTFLRLIYEIHNRRGLPDKFAFLDGLGARNKPDPLAYRKRDEAAQQEVEAEMAAEAGDDR